MTHLIKINEFTRFLHKAGVKAEFQKVQLFGNTGLDLLNYLATVHLGVYTVQRKQFNVVEHSADVDADRKLILNSSERFPIRLSERLLRSCGESEGKKSKISSVRRTVDQFFRHKEKYSYSK